MNTNLIAIKIADAFQEHHRVVRKQISIAYDLLDEGLNIDLELVEEIEIMVSEHEEQVETWLDRTGATLQQPDLDKLKADSASLRGLRDRLQVNIESAA